MLNNQKAELRRLGCVRVRSALQGYSVTVLGCSAVPVASAQRGEPPGFKYNLRRPCLPKIHFPFATILPTVLFSRGRFFRGTRGRLFG